MQTAMFSLLETNRFSRDRRALMQHKSTTIRPHALSTTLSRSPSAGQMRQKCTKSPELVGFSTLDGGWIRSGGAGARRFCEAGWGDERAALVPLVTLPASMLQHLTERLRHEFAFAP